MKKNCLFSVLAQSRERGKVSVRLAMRQQTTFAPVFKKRPAFQMLMTLTTAQKSV
jgi:hypothetical protein